MKVNDSSSAEDADMGCLGISVCLLLSIACTIFHRSGIVQILPPSNAGNVLNLTASSACIWTLAGEKPIKQESIQMDPFVLMLNHLQYVSRGGTRQPDFNRRMHPGAAALSDAAEHISCDITQFPSESKSTLMTFHSLSLRSQNGSSELMSKSPRTACNSTVIRRDQYHHNKHLLYHTNSIKATD